MKQSVSTGHLPIESQGFVYSEKNIGSQQNLDKPEDPGAFEVVKKKVKKIKQKFVKEKKVEEIIEVESYQKNEKKENENISNDFVEENKVVATKVEEEQVEVTPRSNKTMSPSEKVNLWLPGGEISDTQFEKSDSQFQKSDPELEVWEEECQGMVGMTMSPIPEEDERRGRRGKGGLTRERRVEGGKADNGLVEEVDMENKELRESVSASPSISIPTPGSSPRGKKVWDKNEESKFCICDRDGADLEEKRGDEILENNKLEKSTPGINVDLDKSPKDNLGKEIYKETNQDIKVEGQKRYVKEKTFLEQSVPNDEIIDETVKNNIENSLLSQKDDTVATTGGAKAVREEFITQGTAILNVTGKDETDKGKGEAIEADKINEVLVENEEKVTIRLELKDVGVGVDEEEKLSARARKIYLMKELFGGDSVVDEVGTSARFITHFVMLSHYHASPLTLRFLC